MRAGHSAPAAYGMHRPHGSATRSATVLLYFLYPLLRPHGKHAIAACRGDEERLDAFQVAIELRDGRLGLRRLGSRTLRLGLGAFGFALGSL
jgi:hypothetical protein